jgi:hypothetical protein
MQQFGQDRCGAPQEGFCSGRVSEVWLSCLYIEVISPHCLTISWGSALLLLAPCSSTDLGNSTTTKILSLFLLTCLWQHWVPNQQSQHAQTAPAPAAPCQEQQRTVRVPGWLFWRCASSQQTYHADDPPPPSLLCRPTLLRQQQRQVAPGRRALHCHASVVWRQLVSCTLRPQHTPNCRARALLCTHLSPAYTTPCSDLP